MFRTVIAKMSWILPGSSPITVLRLQKKSFKKMVSFELREASRAVIRTYMIHQGHFDLPSGIVEFIVGKHVTKERF